MSTDISRQSFAEPKHFLGVLAQMGRVQLDSDWNEQAAITAHHDVARAGDIIGPTGGPAPVGGGPGPFGVEQHPALLEEHRPVGECGVVGPAGEICVHGQLPNIPVRMPAGT